MKKVLIISYFFEPSNFVGAERVNAWKKYLPELNIYPIILTRFWKDNQTNINKIKDFQEIDILKNKQCEVHRIPEKWTIRDRIIKSNKFIFLRKALTFYQLLCDILWFKKSQYYFLYEQAIQVIKNERDIDTIIISGTPFHSFAIGYYLKIKYPHLKWFPDYRDQWNTHDHIEYYGLLRSLLVFLEKKKEKLWTSNATKFITVSENWKDRIENFILKEGVVVKNGMDTNVNMIYPVSIPRNNDQLCISYVGTIYPYQRIDLLLKVIRKIKLDLNYSIKVNFIGINALENNEIKIVNDFPELRENFSFFERMPANNLNTIYANSDLLWLTSFDKMKGWYPVKLFDYAKQGIPILLFPTDNDVIEKFVDDCSVGFYFSEEYEVFQFLIDILFNKKKYLLNINHLKLNEYTRENQTKILAELVNKG